jgi:AraC-like DNA-binding protein
MKSWRMTIPCKRILRFGPIEAVRPEGLDVEKRGVLFPYEARQKWRVFFCAPKRCTLTKKGSPVIEVQYEAPDGRLAGLISTFYRFDYRGDDFCEIERADRAQFRFQLVGEGEYQFASGEVAPTFPVTVIGPTTAPVTAKAQTSLSIFGWGMDPAGWAALMGSAAVDYLDRAFDARLIFGDWIMHVREELIAAQNFPEQVELGCIAAETVFRYKSSAPFEFTRLVDNWLESDADPDVEILATATDLSQRQLERMTKRHYGMPPKKLARKYRALKAAQLLAHGDSLDDAGLGLAFYDQSHLIREVKQFTGLTPGQLRAGQSQLTRATMDGRRSLGGKVSPLISES